MECEKNHEIKPLEKKMTIPTCKDLVGDHGTHWQDEWRGFVGEGEKNISACGAALEPFPMVSFRDLFAGSFLGAISYMEWARVPKWKQKRKKWWLRTAKPWIAWAPMPLERWGRFWGEWSFTPAPFKLFLCKCVRPGELTLHLFFLQKFKDPFALFLIFPRSAKS